MKKLALLLLCAIFVIRPVYAADIDLSGYSVEELLALQDKVDSALFEKGGLTVIDPGNYTVGVDIAAGSYVIKPHTDGDRGYVEYSIFKTEEAIEKYENARNKYKAAYSQALDRDSRGEEANWPRDINNKKFMSDEGTIWPYDKDGAKITLKDGQVLVLEESWAQIPMTIEKAGGLFIE